MKLDPYLTSHTEINSERIQDLNVRFIVTGFLELSYSEFSDKVYLSPHFSFTRSTKSFVVNFFVEVFFTGNLFILCFIPSLLHFIQLHPFR